MPEPPPKACAVCGREIRWRRKWARDWDSVRYCGDRCRRTGLTPTDHALELAIIDLLRSRTAGKSICPSEAARAVGGTDWRPLMPQARYAANRLAAAGKIVLTQRGRPADPSHARGAVRLRLPD